jgi:hypothetical protein
LFPNRGCSNAIAFQLCFRIRYYERSGNPGWLEIKWHTSAFGLFRYVNILGGSVHTVKEKAEALVVASKEIRLDVSADKTKYMVMSRDQTAGGIQSIKYNNISFENGEQFKYLGTILTNQNSIQEEIKR